MKNYLFETETCSRCSGTGRYSFCQRYADRCFKCGGATVTLTKRGHAAQAYFRKLCEVSAWQVMPGDRIRVTGITRGGGVFEYTAPVVEVKTLQEEGRAELTTESPKFGRSTTILAIDALIEVRNLPNREEKVAKALAYQATLTKQGKERKRPVASDLDGSELDLQRERMARER